MVDQTIIHFFFFQIDELEAQVVDLKEQVDAALGAEEMVEQLGDKKMELEDKVSDLKRLRFSGQSIL